MSMDEISDEIEVKHSNSTTKLSSNSQIGSISDPLITYSIPMISVEMIKKDKIIGKFL